MIEKIYIINEYISIAYCITSKEIVLYEDWLCLHWEDENESLQIIKDYINDNNIDINLSYFINNEYISFDILVYKLKLYDQKN